MSEFLNFLNELNKICNYDYNNMQNINTYELAAKVLIEINKFFYQKTSTLPSDYFSDG